MRSFRFTKTIASLSLIALGASACGGAGFDPPDKIKTLRVLAVQKDVPYPQPGEDVNLKLLYWDGKAPPGGRRDIQINFYGPCVNPQADLYYNCFADLKRLRDLFDGGLPSFDASIGAPIVDGGVDALDMDGSEPEAGVADDASLEGGIASYEADHVEPYHLKIPRTNLFGQPIIRTKTPPGVPPYGLVFVLFTACAGTVEFGDPTVPNAVPAVCRDASGRVLGAEDFVSGYTSIYVYDDPTHRNANPVMADFRLDDRSLLGSPGLGDADVPHIPRCTKGDCPQHDLHVVLPPAANQELDKGARGLQGQELGEQMWLAWSATGGSFDHSLRLVNDASQGWQWSDDTATKFTAPAEPGPLRIWAVVHDNRGGVAWIEGKIVVVD